MGHELCHRVKFKVGERRNEQQSMDMPLCFMHADKKLLKKT